MLATSWFKENKFCTENYADLIKCTYFVVLDVCKSLRAICPSALQDSPHLSEGLQTLTAAGVMFPINLIEWVFWLVLLFYCNCIVVLLLFAVV